MPEQVLLFLCFVAGITCQSVLDHDPTHSEWRISTRSCSFITASYLWCMLLVPEVFLRATGKNCFCAWTGTCNFSKMRIIASIKNNNSRNCHKPLGPRYIYPWLLWQCQVPCRRSPKDLVEVLGPLLRTLYE